MKLDQIVEDTQGTFATVTFTKKDGSVRVMNCRLGVTKHLKGGECTLDREKFLIVYDMQSKGYRSINRSTIISVKAKGHIYD